jgi:hypothetical protein
LNVQAAYGTSVSSLSVKKNITENEYTGVASAEDMIDR